VSLSRELRSAVDHAEWSQSIWNVVGTPLRVVTLCWLTSSRTRPASNLDSSTTVAPLSSIGSKPISSDATWNRGEIISATSLRFKSMSTTVLMQFHVMLPCVSSAPFGLPVVPEV
jgi:hypothetical protein